MRIFALLVVLLACAATVAEGAPCDTVSCGMGTCKELPPPLILLLPAYVCECYPGWANFVSLPFFNFTACYIPTCPVGENCYVPTLMAPPLGNITLHPCLGMDCGPGTCVEEQGKPLQCQCEPGAANLLDNPSLPCSKDCAGSQNGCKDPNTPPSTPTPPSSAPPGNDTSSTGPTAPSSTKGNPSSLGCVCLQNMLLLALLAALHVVV